jgi:NADPH2:quinone reductase
MLIKRLTHTGSTLRSRTPAEKAQLIRSMEEQVWPLLAAGTVKPLIYRTFPLAQARQAHELMDSGKHIGKIVLTMDAG